MEKNGQATKANASLTNISLAGDPIEPDGTAAIVACIARGQQSRQGAARYFGYDAGALLHSQRRSGTKRQRGNCR